jgi:uncharacterized membrane protein YczE
MKWTVLVITILIFNTVVILMKKRLKISEIYTTVTFGLLIDLLVDIYASFRFKAWGFFEVEKVEFSAMLIILGIYPAAAAMIINWYPYKSVWWLKLCYLLGWTVFSTAYEWLTLKVGILWYKNWSLYYSFLIYPFIYYILILHVRIYQWIKQKER